MQFNSLLIRASSIGKVMTDPRAKADKDAGILGDTCTSYLKQLYREIKYSRRKDYTSKAIEKGIRQEEDALTLLSLTKRIFLTKNKDRLFNDFISGEPDTFIGKEILKAKEGFDVKCSWDLHTFPFEDEPLDKMYYWQDMGYMWLTGAEKWTTAYCLVNAPANLITNEKQKIWYALDCPTDDNDRYLEKRREIEKNMIFNLAQFRSDNPGFDLDIEDWRYDIPDAERIIQFPVDRNEQDITRIKERIIKCREWMNRTYPILLASHDQSTNSTIITAA